METGLIAIEIAARIHSVPMDVQSVRKKYFVERELSPEEMIRILRDHGFKANHRRLSSLEELKGYPLPQIILTPERTFHVLIGMKDGKCLIFDTGEKAIREVDEESLKGLWSGEVVALRPRFKQTEFYSSFKWLFMEFFRFRSIFYEVLGASFFIQSFGLVTPLFIQVIIDKVLPHHAVATLQVVAAAFLTVIVFESFMNFLRNYLLYHTANKIDAGLGARVYRHLLSLPYRYFETRRVGNIIARVRELENLRQFMTNVSLTVLLDTVFSVVFIVIMALYSVTLTLMVLAFVAVIALVSFIATPHIKAKLDEKFHKGAMAQSFLVESITGIQTVKSMALEGKMVRNWENHLGDYIQSAFNLANVGNVAVTASQALQKLMTLAVIYFGVGLVFDNRLSVGQLIAFQMFASQLSGPILRLVNMWQDFQQARLSLERIGDIVNTPSEVTGGSVSLRDLQGSIVFKDVKFRYAHDGPLVLDGVSLAIQPGEMIGIVGRSGSGKSTVAKLVQRLYHPQEGVIAVDNIDLRHMDPLFLRHRIGMVPQDSFLFSGTIRENITMAMPDADMERVMAASRVAGAHEFISEMPLGYDSIVEERGVSLSGGQRQRISIARALITNPRFIIFDEATSALDYESERAIKNHLGLIRKGRTVILIAHRLNMMRDCDRIIVLDRGRIVETGDHVSLIKKGGLYAHLCKQQEIEGDGSARVQAHPGRNPGETA
jgi:subfamily B ATP-binding cassette protein HlyB/CyaB